MKEKGLNRHSLVVGSFLLLFSELSLFRADAAEANGFVAHKLESPHQGGETTLRVLLPDTIEVGKRYPVLYVLPVHEEGLFRHGDGLEEVRKAGFHNSSQLICVSPSFTSKPWFADHDLNPKKQDESHLLKTVIPFVESHYPVQASLEGRLLLGFSKSGWGAITLLLRHPKTFFKAVGWDTGIRVDTGPIEESDRAERIAREWGTPENFERYRMSSLIKTEGMKLGSEARLFYYNVEGRRGPGGAIIHRLLVESGIPHRYLYEPERVHRWDSGWLPKAIRFLVNPSE